jgi:hypothetical protein
MWFLNLGHNFLLLAPAGFRTLYQQSRQNLLADLRMKVEMDRTDQLERKTKATF